MMEAGIENVCIIRIIAVKNNKMQCFVILELFICTKPYLSYELLKSTFKIPQKLECAFRRKARSEEKHVVFVHSQKVIVSFWFVFGTLCDYLMCEYGSYNPWVS